MASVVRRRRKNGAVSWYARYRDGRGKDVWEKCASARAARARAAEVEVMLARSGGSWSRPPRMTIAEYTETWLLERRAGVRPRTIAEYERVFRRDILPELGAVQLAALSRADLKRYAVRRAACGAAANTIRNGLAPLRAMLSSAVEDGLVRENVALRLPRVGRPARVNTPPSRQDVAAVLLAATHAGRGPIELAAASGLRRGEVFALRWGDVDFERRLVCVRASNHNGEIAETKTSAGERLVPMFDSLCRLLAELRAESTFTAPDDFVFHGARGEPRNPAGWMRWEFYPALKRAGVRPFRFHDLRHFAVSQLIAQGANILQISRIAGHADPSITLKVYSHLLADGLTDAARRYDPLSQTR